VCKAWDEFHYEWLRDTHTQSDRLKAAFEVWKAENAAADQLPYPASEAARIAARKKHHLSENDTFDWYVKSTISLVGQLYSDITRESQRYWEFVIPFARCTERPERHLGRIWLDIMSQPELILDQLMACKGNYHDDVSYADVQEAQEAVKEAMRLMEATPLKVPIFCVV